MRKRVQRTVLLLAVLLSHASTAYANGYNRISEIAIPFLVVVFAIAYPVIAFLPALMVFGAFRLASKRKGKFSRAYLGACLAGEIGIGICVAIARFCTDSEVWNSYHYTVYPGVIGGLAIAGGVAGYLLSRKPRQI